MALGILNQWSDEMSESLTFQHDPEGIVLRYIEDPRPDMADLVMIHYSGLVERVARKFAGIEAQEDLVQVGYIGLLNALNKFDPKAGVRFHTYATHLVAGEIKHYLRDRSQMIRLPAWLQELRTRVNKTAVQMQAELGRTPSPREGAEALQLTESAVLDVWQAQELMKVASLDQPMSEDDSSEIDDLGAAENAPASLSIEERVVLEDAMTQLRDLEHQVLVLFHFESLSQTEIASRLGISCNYVSHILRQSLNKLRRILVQEEEKDRHLRLEDGGLEAEVVDSETGVYAEDYLYSRLTEEAHRARSEGVEVSAILIRFEGVEQLVAVYGEGAVRDLMIDAAELLRANVRRLDCICRHGNVGFGTAWPRTGPTGHLVSARLQDLLAKFASSRFAPTASVQVQLDVLSFPNPGYTVQSLIEYIRSCAPKVAIPVNAYRAHRRRAA